MSAFDTFKQSFNGEVVTKDSAEYKQAIHRYFVNSEKQARFVCYPANETDVGRALKFGKEEGVGVVVCGGGHSAAGASSIVDGLVIDLSRHFAGVEVVLPSEGSSEGGWEGAYVKCGGGSRWKDVDGAGMKHGLATVAGLVSNTGVGGLTLGGGIGWLTSKHGLTCDNLIGARVALASGEVVEVDKDRHPDLFWALRGGGGAFGVVLELRLKLHPTSKVAYMRVVGVPSASSDAAIAKFLEWARTVDEDTFGGLAFDRNPEGEQIILHWATFMGEQAKVGDRLSALDQLEAHAVIIDKEMPYEEANNVIGAFEPEGQCRYWTATNPRPTKEVFKTLFESFIEKKEQEAVPGSHMVMQAVAFNNKAFASVSKDETAYCNRSPDSLPIQLNLVWNDPSTYDAAKAHAFMADLRGQIAQLQGTPSLAGYSNFESNENQSRAEDLYGENLSQLKTVKAKYDPDGVFGGKFGL